MLATTTRKRNVSSRGKKDSKKAKYDKIMSDFIVFCEEYTKIVNNYGDLVPFILNDEQRDFVSNMSKFNLILKSRQIGFSTISLAYCLWQALNKANTSYLIVSLDNKGVTELFNRLKRMNFNLPREKYSYFPTTIKDNRDELAWSNGSRIIVSVPSENVGRGSTFQYVLLSEFAFYELDQAKLLTSVTQSLAKNNDSKIVIESTANATGNYFYDLCTRSEKGKTNYKAFFYGWISNAHKTQFKAEIDQAVEWYKANNKRKRLSEADLVTDELKHLYKLGATLNMLMWREWKLSSLSDKTDFYKEFPATAEQAFVTSGTRYVFDQAKIVERLNYIPQPLDSELLKRNLPADLHKWIGKGLNVYKLPMNGHKYWLGSDVASGVGGDSSTISIINAENEEVFSFNNNKISVYEMAELLNVVGRFYNYAFQAIERNGGYGLPVIERLRNEYEYMNIYKHKTFDNKGQRKLVLGWLTTEQSKAIMITDLKEQFQQGQLLINDKETLQQMQIFVEQKNGKLGNQRGNGNFDDLVVSLGLAVQARKNGKCYV